MAKLSKRHVSTRPDGPWPMAIGRGPMAVGQLLIAVEDKRAKGRAGQGGKEAM